MSYDNFPNIPGERKYGAVKSDSFPNIDSGSLPNTQMSDPNNTSSQMSGQGMVKNKTDMSGAWDTVQYGSNDKGIGTGKYDPTPGSSGYNINGNVTPMTSGDPNNTAI